ncbi:MAG TPA: SAM-dependent methyltransferase [Firmicutes bacterium]|jgi:tRNA (adenine22-N1)-methyltransferase|nr:SAM-dependent methyltransferase [Bacillota bacterium]
MQINLGLRLQRVADFVPETTCIADIGSDHGYLAAWLLLTGRVQHTIAGELNRDPAERARLTACAAGLEEKMLVREGAGLSVLQPGEVDTVVIAGMGGATIVQILESNPSVLPDLRRLVLQPNIGGAQVRHWLSEHGWAIIDEALVAENSIIYEIIVAEPGEMQQLTALQAEIGPMLLDRKPEHFSARVQAAIDARQYVVAQLVRSTNAAVASKREQLMQQISDLESLIE